MFLHWQYSSQYIWFSARLTHPLHPSLSDWQTKKYVYYHHQPTGNKLIHCAISVLTLAGIAASWCGGATIVLCMSILIPCDCNFANNNTTVSVLYFCVVAAVFSVSQCQEAQRLKTTNHKAIRLKVVLRLQIKLLPGNSSRMESMTTWNVSELQLENNIPEIQESEFCMLLQWYTTELPVPCPVPTKTGFKCYQKTIS